MLAQKYGIDEDELHRMLMGSMSISKKAKKPTYKAKYVSSDEEDSEDEDEDEEEDEDSSDDDDDDLF